ncbi:class I SAM-dependent methyltransferase [Arachidicoccus ginsenosidimutans]|uniref:class I SAM-dependent methyltransferase n=1 Tax=Arachidicoccus sp. BS20 TaxID=1850526 RepID=UPI000AACED03|nr:class I SAM-dependent methyltransferase [Arachidicoccus sp. BS20]
MIQNSTTRFSNRVDNYVKYRPGYPMEIVDFLQAEYQLSNDKTIADIGSGTGISSKLFLDNGYKVIGIEPNKEMREKSEELLHNYKNFSTVAGTAENTLLENHSVDTIIAGQAFHWFDKTVCRKEFERILQPHGSAVLIWNERLADSDFEKEYDRLIVKHSIDYVKVDHRNIDEKSIKDFFAPHTVELKIFSNRQIFDFDGLRGRLLSSSYAPSENHAGYQPMLDDLKTLFKKYQTNNRITIHYATKVYVTKF